MTVSYQSDVASSTSGGLFRLLWRWRGSVWKLVYLELFAFCAAYLSLALAYDFLFPEWLQRLVTPSPASSSSSCINKMYPLCLSSPFKQVLRKGRHLVLSVCWNDSNGFHSGILCFLHRRSMVEPIHGHPLAWQVSKFETKTTDETRSS